MYKHDKKTLLLLVVDILGNLLIYFSLADRVTGSVTQRIKDTTKSLI